jgi:RNA polymerase primary sigma factor
MTTERAQRAIDVLLDDAARQAGSLSQSQIERVLDRRKLDPVECLAVYRALDEHGLLADENDREALDSAAQEGDHDDADSGEVAGAETPEGAPDAPADGEPTADEPTTEVLSNLPADLAAHSLLTPAEEIELGRTIRLGREMAAAIAESATPETDHALDAVRRGAEARERMIRSNFRLVLKVAYPYAHSTSMEVDDLIQEGLLGLMRAVEKFDHSKGFRFSTYAFWWIRQAITRAIADKGDTVRLPVHVKEKVYRLRKAIRVLRRFNEDRFPSIGRLADELHWPRDRVQFLLDLSKTVALSLDAPLKDDEHQSLLDLIADEAPGPADIVAASDEHEAIERVLGTLTERERVIITKRFGLDRVAELTLEEIGQQYDLTRERIRQLESKALKRLAHPSRSGPLRELLGSGPEPGTGETDDAE